MGDHADEPWNGALVAWVARGGDGASGGGGGGLPAGAGRRGRASGCRSNGRRRRWTSAYALSTLGKREKGTEHLEEAVAAYRLALQVRTRERVPLQWAQTQVNLGVTLATLGERETGTEPSGGGGGGLPAGAAGE